MISASGRGYFTFISELQNFLNLSSHPTFSFGQEVISLQLLNAHPWAFSHGDVRRLNFTPKYLHLFQRSHSVSLHYPFPSFASPHLYALSCSEGKLIFSMNATAKGCLSKPMCGTQNVTCLEFYVEVLEKETGNGKPGKE